MGHSTQKNPFKFGSVVDVPYFTNRVEELAKIKSILNSEVHIILMSPRRYGKTSLIKKAVQELDRPALLLDLQLITSELDFAEQLLKRLYGLFPFEKLKGLIKKLPIVPTLSMNPATDEVTISFQGGNAQQPVLDDVLSMLNGLSTKRRKLIVVFDEFQAVQKIDINLEKRMRSIMQNHNQINYVFLGSQESLMQGIFEDVKAPFYRFGYVMRLGKIAEENFKEYILNGIADMTEEAGRIADQILARSHCHPYYTQQLAYEVWDVLRAEVPYTDAVDHAVNTIVLHHDNDYERLWLTLNKQDMKVMTGLALSDHPATSFDFQMQFHTGSTSTTYSALQRLIMRGLVVKDAQHYEIEDPFFTEWLKARRA